MERKISRCVSELCPSLPGADQGQGVLQLCGGEQARPRSGCPHPPHLLPSVLIQPSDKRLKSGCCFLFPYLTKQLSYSADDLGVG